MLKNSVRIVDDYKDRFKNIDKIIINGLATIVILNSGKKGVAKCVAGDTWDIDIGILNAYITAIKKEHRGQIKKIKKTSPQPWFIDLRKHNKE